MLRPNDNPSLAAILHQRAKLWAARPLFFIAHAAFTIGEASAKTAMRMTRDALSMFGPDDDKEGRKIQ